MKQLASQNHYEILEVARDARPEDIERSYRLAQSTFADDSMAGYSVFDEGDARALRDRLEAAYRVLSDAELRRAYDTWLENHSAPAERPPLAEPARPAPLARQAAPEIALEELEDEPGEFDGPRLRRVRLSRGVEIDEIAGVTKVSPNFLRFLEEERYAELPAPVYVRGFVVAYAECVGLDGRRVATSYMRKYREQQQPGRRRGQ